MNKSLANRSCFFITMNMGQTEATFIANIVTCILNSLFSPITCAGNFIIVYVIRKSRNLHSPSFFLLGCLAFADFLVGAICQPTLVGSKIAELQGDPSLICPLRMLQSMSAWITGSLSFFLLALVSIDRLLALTLHLRYNSVVTVSRMCFAVLLLWITAAVIVSLKFAVTNWKIIPLLLLLITFLVIAFCTYKIFHLVEKHRRQIREQNIAMSLGANASNELKCRKSAVTILYVYGLLLTFYIPLFATVLADNMIQYTRSVHIAYAFSTTTVFINSFLNPVVYCLRIREIRQAVVSVLRRPQQHLLNRKANNSVHNLTGSEDFHQNKPELLEDSLKKKGQTDGSVPI
ncbi:melanocyte-stimulating hormone receptor-like [Montipora capricornis]|uniref:melanocyte-stimulating hormone receptor-like n=1 Tax=Montipora capricornis TaxID=246305 RepID=UPI0035F11D62